jgi:hypothetical protein
MHRVHSDLDAATARIYSCMKLLCNKRRAYIESSTPPSKRRPHFETRICPGENKNIVHGSRGELSQEWPCWRRPEAIEPTNRLNRSWRLPEPLDGETRSWVPWGLEPRITARARASSNLAVSQVASGGQIWLGSQWPGVVSMRSYETVGSR